MRSQLLKSPPGLTPPGISRLRLLDGEWLKAAGTTLGADYGIGEIPVSGQRGIVGTFHVFSLE